MRAEQEKWQQAEMTADGLQSQLCSAFVREQELQVEPSCDRRALGVIVDLTVIIPGLGWKKQSKSREIT